MCGPLVGAIALLSGPACKTGALQRNRMQRRRPWRGPCRSSRKSSMLADEKRLQVELTTLPTYPVGHLREESEALALVMAPVFIGCCRGSS